MFMYVPKAIKVPTEILSAFKITIPTKYNEMHPSPQDKSIIEPKQSLIRIAFLNDVLCSFTNWSKVSSVSFSPQNP